MVLISLSRLRDGRPTHRIASASEVLASRRLMASRVACQWRTPIGEACLCIRKVVEYSDAVKSSPTIECFARSSPARRRAGSLASGSAVPALTKVANPLDCPLLHNVSPHLSWTLVLHPPCRHAIAGEPALTRTLMRSSVSGRKSRRDRRSSTRAKYVPVGDVRSRLAPRRREREIVKM